jgi:hypothetical protein
MQLILTHADLSQALIESLQAKGMTAFDPRTCSVEFSFKRGTKELICTLDTEAPVAVVAEAPKQTLESPTATISASAAVAPEAASVVVAEEPAPVVQAEAPVATTAEPVPELETAGGDDDNLFD